ASGAREGYAVVWGAEDGNFALELVRQSTLNVIVVEDDSDKRQSLRERALEHGLAAARLSVVPGGAQLPPYFCTLLTTRSLPQEAPHEAFLQAVFNSLRPYGGVACLPLSGDNGLAAGEVKRWLGADPERSNGRLRQEGRWLLLSREGALPGA